MTFTVLLSLAGDFGNVVAGGEDAYKCVEGRETDGKEHDEDFVVGEHTFSVEYVAGKFG